MSIRSLEIDHSGPSPTDIHETRQQPEKVSRAHIAAQRKLEVIDSVLTSGSVFLDRYLDLSTIEHHIVPGYGDQPIAVAVVHIQSIRILGQRIGMCNDTTGKYVLLYCALGLLYKRRYRNSIELYFPLDRYTLPSLDSLDSFLASKKEKYRESVLRSARVVRGRFALLYGTTSSPARAVPSSLHCTREELQSILADENIDSEQRQRIIARLEKLQRTRKPHRLSENSVDSEANGSEKQDGLSETDVDSEQGIQEQGNRLSEIGVDSEQNDTNEQDRLSETDVDSNTALDHTQATITGKNVDSETDVAQNHGLSNAHVDSDALSTVPNVNVIITSVIDSINVNVSPVAEYLRVIFGEEPRKRGYYHNLYKTHRQTDAWLAATIETLTGLHKTKTIKNAGKYFYDRCVMLHEQGIPPETSALVQQYGQLTYAQLLEVLQKPPTSLSEASRTSATRPAPHRQEIRLHIPRVKAVSGMSRQDLKEVVKLISNTTATYSFLVQAYQQMDGTCALLVDDGMQHSRQTWVYSLQEWKNRVNHMKTVGDLFSR